MLDNFFDLGWALAARDASDVPACGAALGVELSPSA